MAFALGPRAAQADYRLAEHETLGSTNSEALAGLRAGEPGPLWIVAQRQTQGRGRRGRVWQSPEGNLAASLLVRPDVALPVAATLGFVAALAVHRAVANCTSGLSLRLKWPNDVLVEGRKLAGILLESEAGAGGTGLAVGVGINAASAPQDTPFPAISLAALGQPVSAEHLFAELSDAWSDFYDAWDQGRGLPSIRAQWLDRAAGLGQEITVQTGDAILQGLFETLDAEGRLVLRTEGGGRAAIAAGDVYFGGAATFARPR
jgi:BirA family biotin operon repressor/biotin-[acetyl-CoA-carboxylase] ligase